MKPKIIKGQKALEEPQMIEELLKGGLKKGEIHHFFSYTGIGATSSGTPHPDIRKRTE